MKFKLKDLISIKHGYAFKGEDFSDQPTQLQILTPGNVTIGGGFQFGKGKWLSLTTEYPKEYEFKAGDMFVSMTDLSKAGDTLGYPAIIPVSDRVMLHNQRLGRVEVLPNVEEVVLKKYLYYAMRTREYHAYIVSGATGTTVRHTSPSKILDYEFDLPSYQEQQRIVGILSPIEDKINVLNDVNDNLFELSRILFEAVLEDEHSEWTSLANLTDIQNGFAFKSGEYIGFSDTPIVRTLNIGTDNLFDTQNLKYISDESRAKYQKFEFKTFDTALVMVGASIGKTGFVTSRTNGGLQNQNMWRFRPLNSDVPGLYMYNLVTYANSRMQGYKTGSAREFYTKDAFKNFEVPVGNVEIYKAFFAIQDLLDNNASQVTTLNAMRDEILAQVMA